MRKVKVEYKVAIYYLLVGAIWILFSDFFVNLITNDPEYIHALQTYKGWFFVLVTALIFFFYIQRKTNRIRQINSELMQSKSKYMTLYEKAPVAFFSLNANGEIFDVNPAWLKLLKHNKEDVIGEAFVDFLHPDFKSHFEHGLELLKKNEAISDLRLRIRKKNLDYIIVTVEGNIHFDTNKGEILSYCAMKDITAESEAKVQLVERESRYRAMFHKNMSVMLIIDGAGNIRESNKAAQFFYGYDQQELHALDMDVIVHDGGDTLLKMLESLKSNHQEVFEHQHQLRSGEIKDVLIFASKIMYKSDAAYYLIIHDITPRKNAEKELKKAKEQAEENTNLIKAFLNNISHELRTPMNSIMGFSQMLIRPNKAEDKKKKYIQHINESCHVLLDKITDTIDISRIESNYQDSFIDTFDLSFLINEVLKPYYSKVKELQNKIVVIDQLDEEHKQIKSDKYKVRRIVKHLLDNATKNTKNGIIQIKIFFDDLRDMYLLEVSDSGIGVDEHMQTKIFEPYVQVKRSPKELAEGNGIGLTIVKSFAEQIGGQVSFRSAPQKGTKVTVLIPPMEKS